MRQKLIAFIATAAFAASPAFAADAIVVEPTYEPQAIYSAYDWTGVYIGVQGGYAWTTLTAPGGREEDRDGGSAGLHGGYNFQHGNFVFGIENDINYNWGDDADNGQVGLELDGSLRGRLGYALDRTLFYGTAGIAAAQAELELGRVKEDDLLIGWTAGAGVEHAFTDNITVRAEYRYTDFGSADFGPILGEHDVSRNKVGFGASYKF
ncbi:outer membrane protein [Mesorhizobium sp. CN2-181]|uniref:outer membrane protein n=1 Tax=Mesorhizobium yinganensis TaxID=3157707 RepID=UPI0032B75741